MISIKTGLSIVSFLSISPIAANAQTDQVPFNIDIPIDCDLNQDCWVVNYFDQDPSDNAADFKCGPHSYNTHSGTDFAITDLLAMREGVSVVASAPGKVIGIRNHMQDISVADIGRDALKGLDCGNGVSVEHENGWRTQHCHMRKGSVTVAVGDKVNAGDKLGLVGLSGNTVFPHVHLSVFKDGQKVDPYSVNRALACSGTPKSIWSNRARKDLKYRPAVPYIAGFADERADSKKARDGAYKGAVFNSETPIITFWADHYNLRGGDRLEMSMRAPNAQVISEHTQVIDKNKARWFQFIGRRKPKSGWPKGTYTAEIKVYPFDQDTSSVRRKIVTVVIK
jgi:hypothetical protein